MQYHDHRNEIWFVARGIATVWTMRDNKELIGNFEKFSIINIAKEQWHQLENQQATELSIIEIQYGDSCVEQDIHRINL
jgi:mannose-6-phosphate isomerase-like protein (cupin superfamily)